MNLIIHHSVAWKQACAKYKIETVGGPPDFFPVLLSFNESADGDLITTVSLVSPEMAVKFLTTLSYERWCKIDADMRAKLAGSIPTVKAKEPLLIPTVPVDEAAPVTLTVTTTDGKTITWATSQAFEAGQSIVINGQTFIVSGASSMVSGTDPITDEDIMGGVSDYTDPWQQPHQVKQGTIPGIEEMPMDPSKLEAKQKIAEFADPTEHVLDVERSV